MSIGMASLAQRAREQVADITGFRPVAVVGSHLNEDGWHVTVELLEMARLPEATDILGTYVVHLDQEGNMTRFERKGTHLRGQPYGGGEE